jgi:hypothetical protein
VSREDSTKPLGFGMAAHALSRGAVEERRQSTLRFVLMASHKGVSQY